MRSIRACAMREHRPTAGEQQERAMSPQQRKWSLAALAFGAALSASAACAQSITVVREVDSDRYDPHRSTARGASEVLFMLGDTLVSLDYDMQTIKPGLAESWTQSPDGLTYVFNLR